MACWIWHRVAFIKSSFDQEEEAFSAKEYSRLEIRSTRRFFMQFLTLVMVLKLLRLSY